MGYFAARRGIISKPAVGGLNGFVFYFALPAMVYQSLSTKLLEELINLPYMVAYTTVGFVLFALTAFAARTFFNAPLGVMSLFGQGAVVGNVGFLGIPLITAIMGADAAIPVEVAWAIDLVIMVPLSIVLLEFARSGGSHPLLIARDALKAATFNPFVISIALGLAGATWQWELPDLVNNLLNMLASATAPVALFTIGASLWGRPISERLSETALLTTAKLVIHPMLVWFALFVVVPVDPFWATAAVLTASMPIAGNVFVIAQTFNIYVTRCSTAILVSTTAAALLFPLLVAYSGLMDGMLVH